MITGLDHVGLATLDPGAAARAFGLLFAAPPVAEPAVPGGAGPVRRFQLDNMALRIVQGAEEDAFSLGFAADDPAETLRLLDRRGLSTAPEGGLAPAATHGVALRVASGPASAAPPARADAPHALDHVVVMTPDPERAVALYGGRLGLDLRLDRTNPQWGARQLFFRCGGAVVEIAADLKVPAGDGPDRITGLAWRVADPAAARARLAAAGLDVSEVRKGRKPGTAVFTLRAGPTGPPALIIGPTAD